MIEPNPVGATSRIPGGERATRSEARTTVIAQGGDPEDTPIIGGSGEGRGERGFRGGDIIRAGGFFFEPKILCIIIFKGR